MQNELIDQGFTLMLVGMGTVFTFLTALVMVMAFMSWLVTRYQAPPAASAAGDDEIAAIAAAITRHRGK